MFTYNGNPEESILTMIRFLVGDTDSEVYFLEDSEIQAIINLWVSQGNDNVYFLASKVAMSISANVTKEVPMSSDGQSFSLDQLKQRFAELSNELMQEYKELLADGVSVSAGGYLVGEQPDPNIRGFAFGTQMHDDPAAGEQDLGGLNYDDGYSQWGERVPW